MSDVESECGSIEQTPGTIKLLQIKNFMCHANLVVQFELGLNVIVGSNGSGKSAILTSLIFALGGRAHATSRASSFKELIMRDKSFAEVEVTLRNEGSDAYEHETYGDSICIVRKLLSNGVSLYKVKAACGKVINRKKEEIFAIVDHFNIQVDNPVNVLTQECSKTFLRSQDPKAKYKFFMRATNLCQIKEDYEFIRTLQAEIDKRIMSKTESLESYRERLEGLGSQIRLLSELSNAKSKIGLLKQKLVWLEMNELKKERDELSQSLAKLVSKHDMLVQGHTRLTESIESEEKVCTELQNRVSQVKREIDLASNEKHECQSKLRVIAESIQRRTISLDNAKIKLENSMAARHSLAQKTENIEKNGVAESMLQAESIGLAIKTRLSDIDNLQKELAETKEKTRNLDLETWNMKDKQARISIERRAQQKELEHKRSKIDTLRRNVGDSLNVYGTFTNQLLKELRSNYDHDRFKYMPVGPVGSMIEVKQPKWALAVELCLKNYLRSYIVFNYADKEVLSQIISRFVRPEERPPIIITTYQDELYNYERNRPMSSFPTMLDIVSCKDANVLNVLMDQVSIERILCIENTSQARLVMIPHPPANCQRAFTIEGDEIISKGGTSRFYSTRQRNCKLIGRDTSLVAKSLEEECSRVSVSIQNIEQEMASLNIRVVDLERTKDEEKRVAIGIITQINERKSEVSKLEAQLDTLKEVNSSAIEQELCVLDEKIGEFQNQVDSHKSELQQLSATEKDLESSYASVKSRISSIKKTWDETKNVSLDKSEALSCLRQSLTRLSSKCEVLQNQINNVTTELEKIDRKISSAGETNVLEEERGIDVTETKEHLQMEIQQLEKALDSRQLSEEEIKNMETEHEESTASLKNQTQKLKSLATFNRKLISMMKVRDITFSKLRSLIVRRTMDTFGGLLKDRGYEGSLSFDHESSKLFITVNTEKNDQKNNDVGGLSGGEKSFSTLSFIISLWQSMESPFRCLDEFDVFMDMVNRRTGLRLLKDFSMSLSSKQLILITPQDISELGCSENVAVFKLDDPKRTQG